jgi:hypothetical protein
VLIEKINLQSDGENLHLILNVRSITTAVWSSANGSQQHLRHKENASAWS